MSEFPQIKLEIQEMRHAIMHHFDAYQQEVSKEVNRMIAGAIKNYDFEAEVEKAVHSILTASIKESFAYGEGRKAVKASVEKALDNFLK